MTKRLYYRDSELLEFEARIVRTGRSGADYYTVLDCSAFYPTSGGQLHDTGMLNAVNIVDVIESNDKEILHISRQPVGRVGDTVRGVVDGERRWKNRQMHTAQHILSQVFISLSDVETVSVHLGEEYAAIELGAETLSDEQLDKVEHFTNKIIRDNLPVEIIFTESDRLDKLPLRKIPQRSGQIRVIRIGEFDYSACGGTHCCSTAEVGLIKIVSMEKIRGRVLVKFLAGQQALEDYCLRFQVTDALTRSLTCHVNDLIPKIDKLLLEYKQQHQDIARLQKRLLPLRVEELAGMAGEVGGRPMVSQVLADREISFISPLAAQVAEGIQGVAVLYAQNRLVVAVSKASGLHAGELVKRFGEETGLKGGGSERVAQVGGAEKNKFDHYVKVLETLVVNV